MTHKMKIAIIGSRTFNNYELLRQSLDEFSFEANVNISLIVSGGAKGADILGERYAQENNIETMIFLPDWEKHGKSAGFIRNQFIINNADFAIAFWDGESKGTLSSINIAKKQKKGVRVVNF